MCAPGPLSCAKRVGFALLAGLLLKALQAFAAVGCVSPVCVI